MFIDAKIFDTLETQDNFIELLELYEIVSTIQHPTEDIWEKDGKLIIDRINIKDITKHASYTKSEEKIFDNLQQLNKLGIFDD